MTHIYYGYGHLCDGDLQAYVKSEVGYQSEARVFTELWLPVRNGVSMIGASIAGMALQEWREVAQ